jgi:hypothetical protein
MAIYEITKQSISALAETSFAAAGISERGDLQRLLRANIKIISRDPNVAEPELLVIAEEFGDWEDNGKRFQEHRFYCGDAELIYNDGRTFAFTNQWGDRCIDAIDKLIEAFPEHKISYAKSTP